MADALLESLFFQHDSFRYLQYGKSVLSSTLRGGDVFTFFVLFSVVLK